MTAEGDPQTQEEIDDLRGESRWPPTVALLVAIAVPLLLPDRFSLWPKWIGPALLSLFLDGPSRRSPEVHLPRWAGEYNYGVESSRSLVGRRKESHAEHS